MIFLSLFTSIINLIMRGAVISVFWRWFILSQFNNLPTLSFVGAIGLSLFIEAASPGHSLSLQEIEESADATSYRNIMSNIFHFIAFGCILVLGWFIHFFI